MLAVFPSLYRSPITDFVPAQLRCRYTISISNRRTHSPPTHHPCQLQIANNGREVVEMCARGDAFDIMLLDVRMAEMCGDEVGGAVATISAVAVVRCCSRYRSSRSLNPLTRINSQCVL